MNRHRFGNRPAWFAVAAIAVTFAAQGCGSHDALPPAHSASFYPVRGTTDSGGATSLNWIYRVNGGQPVAAGATPGLTVRFADYNVTSDGTVITTSINGAVGGSDGTVSVSGNESVMQTDHLTSDSPATVSERDVDTRLSLAASGVSISEDEMLKYAFGTTPLPTFFDRDDLDTLAVGFSESRDSQAAVTASVTATVPGSPTQSMTMTTTLAASQSWMLVDKLATFQVLNQTYTNVVEVQRTTNVALAGAGTTDSGTSMLWLAKGIGMIREEDSGSSLTGTGTVATELVRTNLVAP